MGKKLIEAWLGSVCNDLNPQPRASRSFSSGVSDKIRYRVVRFPNLLHLCKGIPPPKKMFSFGHCPNNPPSPSFGQLVPQFRTSKTTFCACDRKNTNYDNDDCNDNYDGHFDDNGDKNYHINIQILRVSVVHCCSLSLCYLDAETSEKPK